MGVVCRVERRELNIEQESCKVREICRFEGSELNIKWESCVVRYVWYVGRKEVS